MLSKSAAKTFFFVGTVICAGAFILLTIDTISKVPKQTHSENITEEVARGKDIWDKNNCMGCHTLLGEGAYYAPELTKVYSRRGPGFIEAMLRDPQKMYPGQRKMVNYNFSDQEIKDLVAFFKWIGDMDLNGFPAKPDLAQNQVVAVNASAGGSLQLPAVFKQVCVACHSLQGQGGNVGPALDSIGNKWNDEQIAKWLHDPFQVKADSKMPKLPLSETEITELAAYLSQLKAEISK